MKRLTARDALAAVIMLAVAVPYAGYLIRGQMPFVEDPRGMAAVGAIGLVLAFAVWGLRFDTMFGKIIAFVGAAAIGLGVAAALIGAEGSSVLLAFFIAAVGVVWAAETLFDAGMFHHQT